MQCPGCGYETDDAAVFCPQCRYQFRDIGEEEPAYTADSSLDLHERGIITDERILEEDRPAAPEARREMRGFSEKELVQLDVQLLQPSVLITLIVALVSYTALSAVPFLPFTWGGIALSITGIVCLAAGLVCGFLFFFLMRHSVRSFRSRQ